MYGSFGGYDITLIELETPVTGFQQACLPHPKFNDADETVNHDLAGFGRYFRKDRRGNDFCQTNEFGRSKYHYCNENAACITHKEVPQDPVCARFFQLKTIPAGADEVMIANGRGEISHCFKKINPENSTFGWCKTDGDYYELGRPKNGAGYDSWGFCSKDCFLDETQELSGVLRIKNNVKVIKIVH